MTIVDPDAPGRRSTGFELAILGSLAESPMHGYELRQRLSVSLGSLRMFSYGSLYPMLRRLTGSALIDTHAGHEVDPAPLTSKRSRVVYCLTGAGRERLSVLLGDDGPQAWSDEGFEIHLAFFHRTTAEDRVRILEGRRRRMEERREALRLAMPRAADRLDAYTEGLRRLGLEAAEREVCWLTELIETERRGASPTTRLPDAGPA